MHDSIRLLTKSLLENVADRVELDSFRAMSGEVARSAMLARVEGGDLAVESVGLLLEEPRLRLAFMRSMSGRRRSFRGRLRHSN